MLQYQNLMANKKQIDSQPNSINPEETPQIIKKQENGTLQNQLPQRKNFNLSDDFFIDFQSRIKKGVLPSLKQYRQLQNSPDSNLSIIAQQQNNGNQRKLYNIQSIYKKALIMTPILKTNTLQYEDNPPTQILSSRKKPSLLNSNLRMIRKNQLIFNNEAVSQLQTKTQMDAFWVSKGLPVRVVRAQAQQPCLLIERDGVIKIYGKFVIKFFTYIVVSPLCGVTLENQLQQFGECTEKLIWKYIRNIVKGLREIHQRGTSFNILTLNRILVDLQGNTCIDISRCKYSQSISNQDKKNQFYYLSPQILIYNRDSPKNDIWSLGCIILSLMLGKRIDDDIELHPYNSKDSERQNMNQKQMEIMEKIEKIKKLKKLTNLKDKNSNEEGQNCGKLRGNSHNKNNLSKELHKKFSLNEGKKTESTWIQITEQLFNLMEDCLLIQEKVRPTLEELSQKYESLRQ